MIINLEVEAFNRVANAIAPCVTEHVDVLFPDDTNDEREKKAKLYIRHMTEYAFFNGGISMFIHPMHSPFSRVEHQPYVKSPLKSPPAPRLKLDKDIPSLVDTSIVRNWINNSVTNVYSIVIMLEDITTQCNQFIAHEENLPSDQPHNGELFKKHETEILRIIGNCLDYVFPLAKNRVWKNTTANLFHVQLTSNTNPETMAYAFVNEHMKPYIHRNFCTMVQEGKEEDLNAVISVPKMYSMLFTFLQGSKRKQSLNFNLGLDLTRKIFDHLNIRTPDGVKWISFSGKALN
jgi:hypothetical protein